jgi:TonB-linked outer membrane protein, SusC/RagA family
MTAITPYRRSKWFLVCIVTLLQLTTTRAQDNAPKLSGKVTDNKGQPLAGATVQVKGTTTGASTDNNGLFSLAVPASANTLIVSFSGYKTREIDRGNTSFIEIALEQADRSLEQVVVVGYGTVKKSDLTGSITSLSTKDFNKGSLTSIDQLVSGKAPGVQIVQNSAEPGGGVSIQIRGVGSVTAGSEPLYVIDGLPINNATLLGGTGPGLGLERTPRNPLSTISPQDIESIEILKDASATAIYGSRGANGVILVTTKKGKEGAARINYTATMGVQKVGNRLKLLNAQDYKRILNEIIAEGGGTPGAIVTDIAGNGTDWMKELERPSGAIYQSHNLSVNGGNANTRYYVSLNYLDQEGVFINSGLKNYGLRGNIETNLRKNFKMGLNFSASRTLDQYLSNTDGTNERAGSIFTASHYDPTVPIKNDDGTYYLSPFLSEDNPLALAYGETAKAEAYRTFGNFFAEYNITSELSVKLNLGADIINKRRDEFNSFMTKFGSGKKGFASIFSVMNTNFIAEATAHYKKQFNAMHSLDVVVGATAQEFSNNSYSTNAEGFSTDVLATNNISLGTPGLYASGSNKTGSTLSSFLGRANYSLMNKYLFTGTMRIDGSSRFGSNNKYGVFPSLAFAWKLTQESFMEQQNIFHDLKFRTSWGRTGNQEIGNFNSLSTFGAGPFANFNQQQYASMAPTRMPNPDLKWETTEQWDVGLDMAFLGGRLRATLDYFSRTTTDMLIQLPLPMSLGYASQLRNVGEMKNTGFELLLESQNITTKNFTWQSSLNLSTVKNKVVSLGNIPEIITGSVGFVTEISIIQPGLPINTFYGYEVAGVWQVHDDFSSTVDNVEPGDLKFKDQNGDKTVNASDRVILGNSFPDVQWGFTNTFTYKDISLNFFIEGLQGFSILNNHLVDSYFPVEFRRNKQAEPYLNRWTPDNPGDYYPSFVNPNNQGLKPVNTRTVQDGSYIRLRTATLSYRLPIKNSFVQSANISFTGQNLVTITDYKGVDPASNGSGNPNMRVENNVYPFAKSYLFTLSLGF